jgi:hypothetical protein
MYLNGAPAYAMDENGQWTKLEPSSNSGVSTQGLLYLNGSPAYALDDDGNWQELSPTNNAGVST